MRLGVLVSGAGTNLQAILDTVHGGDGVELVAVASDQADAPALERARGRRRARRAVFRAATIPTGWPATPRSRSG